MKNTVCLINPTSKFVTAETELMHSFNPSFSILSLGTYLELNGYKVILLDFVYTKKTSLEIKELVLNEDLLFIGISSHTENVEASLYLAKKIKEFKKTIPIVFGGAHPSFEYPSLIEERCIDYIILNEGESAILELAENLKSYGKTIKLHDIDNLVYKDDKGKYVNKTRKRIKDLDVLPLPKREYYGLINYGGTVNVITSRGCTGECIYCAANALSEGSYRVRNIKNVFMEILMLYYLIPKIETIYFVDDTFTANKNRLYEYLDIIRKYDFKHKWKCQSRLDVINFDMIKKMAEFGCFEILYGVESGSQEVLNQIKKNIELDYVKEIIKYTYSCKINVVLSFMIGHYCDTVETMKQTTDLITELFVSYYPHPEITLFYNTPFPGTWQYKYAKDIGLKIRKTNFSRFTSMEPIVETENFTLNDQRNSYFSIANYLGYNSMNLLLCKMEEKVNHE